MERNVRTHTSADLTNTYCGRRQSFCCQGIGVSCKKRVDKDRAAAMPRDPSDPSLPFIIEGPVAGLDAAGLAGWITAEAAALDRLLTIHGAILIRGAEPGGAEGFEEVC